MAFNIGELRQLIVDGEMIESLLPNIGDKELRIQRLAGDWFEDAIDVIESMDEDTIDGGIITNEKAIRFMRDLADAKRTLSTWQASSTAFTNLMGSLRHVYNKQTGSNVTYQRFDPNSQDVFLIHGHDHDLLEKFKAVVKAQGLNPIVLAEQPGGSLSLAELLEHYIGNAKGAIVMYTPDDLGKDADTDNEPTPRARENVVYEHGMVTTFFGRQRVVVIHRYDVGLPGDLSGVRWRDLDDKDGEQRLIEEMDAWDNPKMTRFD